jgi:hypothetical protein
MAYAQNIQNMASRCADVFGRQGDAMQQCSLPPSPASPTINSHFSGSRVVYRYIEADKGSTHCARLRGAHGIAWQHLDVTQ